jgi:DNA-binding NtrC family response regulator
MTPAPVQTRGRLLVVDDDLVMLSTLQAILEERFDVRVATGVREARTALEAGAFDVLVTDYEMADGTGAELLKLTAARFAGLYTILLTGKSGFAAVRALQRDGVLVLFKPIDPDDLVGWVKNGVAMAQLTKASDRLRRSGAEKRQPPAPS